MSGKGVGGERREGRRLWWKIRKTKEVGKKKEERQVEEVEEKK